MNVVNHLWLEDVWRTATLCSFTQHRYLVHTAGLNHLVGKLSRSSSSSAAVVVGMVHAVTAAPPPPAAIAAAPTPAPTTTPTAAETEQQENHRPPHHQQQNGGQHPVVVRSTGKANATADAGDSLVAAVAVEPFARKRRRVAMMLPATATALAQRDSMQDFEDPPWAAARQQQGSSSSSRTNATAVTTRNRSLRTATIASSSSAASSASTATTTTTTATTPIRVMFTGFTPSTALLRSLRQLHYDHQQPFQQADRIQECTHLVARKISRTDKFLCGLAYSRFIVTEEWLRECVRVGHAVDESPYLLDDPVAEDMYAMRLRDVLARPNRGHLLDRMVIAATAKIKPKRDQLKAIVEAHGGKVYRCGEGDIIGGREEGRS